MNASEHSRARPTDSSDTQSARSWMHRTPELILGPFYPADRVAPVTRDLTIRGHEGAGPRGELVLVNVRVLDQDGDVLKGVRVEFWQANASGRYRHVLDQSPAPVDPCFDGFGSHVSDELGQLSFRTVRPGAYRTPPGDMRAPHVHFQVTDGPLRLVTQMFFAGEPLNGEDRFLKACLNPAMLVARTSASPDAAVPEFSWQIVLPAGRSRRFSSDTLIERQP